MSCFSKSAICFGSALSALLIFAFVHPASAKCLVEAADDDRRFGSLFTLTASYPQKAADRQRAELLVTTVRATLDDYRRKDAAQASNYEFDRGEDSGRYRMVSRELGMQRRRPAQFDPHFPTALLYAPRSATKSAAILVGAVYVVESDTTGDSLDEIVPLSVARWAWIHPRCRMPGPDLWTLEIFPFEKTADRIWQVPTRETAAIVPYVPSPLWITPKGRT